MTIDKARRDTDRKLRAMERRLSSIYSRTAKELSGKWADYLEEINQEIKSAEDLYEAAKKSGVQSDINKAGKNLDAVKREKIMMNTHYKNLTDDTARALANVNQTALAYINGELPSVYATHYNGVGADLESQVNGYSFELTDENTVKRLATQNKSLLPKKKLDIPADMRWNTKKINAEVLQGILLGDSMDKIANRMRKVTNMNATSAIRNARTMVTGAENAGRMDMLHQAQDDGLEVQKEWIATSDARTRHWHADIDGELKNIDEPFENDFGEIMFPGDPTADPANVYNCRCTLGYKVIGLSKMK